VTVARAELQGSLPGVARLFPAAGPLAGPGQGLDDRPGVVRRLPVAEVALAVGGFVEPGDRLIVAAFQAVERAAELEEVDGEDLGGGAEVPVRADRDGLPRELLIERVERIGLRAERRRVALDRGGHPARIGEHAALVVADERGVGGRRLGDDSFQAVGGLVPEAIAHLQPGAGGLPAVEDEAEAERLGAGRIDRNAGQLVRPAEPFLITAVLGTAPDQIVEVVDVVPVVDHRDALLLHVGEVDFAGGQEGIARLGVLADPVIDMAGHVGDVATAWCERGEDGGAREAVLGARAVLDGVDPVVMGGRVVRMRSEDVAQDRLAVELTDLGAAVRGLIPLAQEVGEEDLRLEIVRIEVDQRLHLLDEPDALLCLRFGRIRLGLLRILLLPWIERRGGADVEALVLARLAAQLDGTVEGGLTFAALLAGVVLQRPPDAPPPHGAGGIETHRLAEGAHGLEVPETVQEIEPLVEIALRLRGAGDLERRVADAVHERRRRKAPHLRHGGVVTGRAGRRLGGALGVLSGGEGRRGHAEDEEKEDNLALHVSAAPRTRV